MRLEPQEYKKIKEFQKYMIQRLEFGREKYKGDRFKDIDIIKLKDNIKEECVDLCNWLFLLYVKLEGDEK